MTFLVPSNSQIIKSRISRSVVLSWTPHLAILLTIKYVSETGLVHINENILCL